MPQMRKQLIMLGDRMRCDDGDDGDVLVEMEVVQGVVRHGKEEGGWRGLCGPCYYIYIGPMFAGGIGD